MHTTVTAAERDVMAPQPNIAPTGSPRHGGADGSLVSRHANRIQVLRRLLRTLHPRDTDVLLHVRVVILNRGAGPSTQPPLVRSRRGGRIAVAAQILAGAWIVGVAFSQGLLGMRSRGPCAPVPPLYGIWIVDKMSIAGVERARLSPTSIAVAAS